MKTSKTCSKLLLAVSLIVSLVCMGCEKEKCFYPNMDVGDYFRRWDTSLDYCEDKGYDEEVSFEVNENTNRVTEVCCKKRVPF